MAIESKIAQKICLTNLLEAASESDCAESADAAAAVLFFVRRRELV
jgi:hypothetical protein